KKKSFRYYFRSEYGQSKLNYQLFKPKDVHEFKRFVTLASFQDAPGHNAYGSGTLLRDAVLHEISRRIEKDISLGTRPVALYLAGRPWGIYNAIERIDNHLLKINFGIDDCDIIENYSEAREGTMDRWNELISFFESSDLRLHQNYERATSCIDIQNFTRYHIVEIYGGNMDWPDNNNIAYCGRNIGDKWKWILWDLDKTFAYTGANTFKKAIREDIKGTIILRKLLENEDYRIYFLNECADFFNTALLPHNVKAIIDSLAAIIRNDIYFEIDRWGGTYEEWEESVKFLKNFADYRLDRLWRYIFYVDEKHLLTVQQPQGGQGKVRINSILIDKYPWSGYYFEDIPIELEAMPDAGFKLKGWNDSLLSSEKKISLIMNEDYTIYPIFEQDTTTVNIVINEINYNSAVDFDPEDWVELYNMSDQTIDLGGWYFKDDNDAHDFRFPDTTKIEAHGFLILCRSQLAFQDLFPEVKNYIGDFGFGLSGNGDAVRIYNSSYILIDSVGYDDKSPWPIEADGNGSTLELIDPKSDNTLPENWRASPGHGSPGEPNLFLPQVIDFVVKDSSGSTRFTNSRHVLIEMTATDSDGYVIKWLINENAVPPAADDFFLTAKPDHYHIESPEGTVTIYGWILDNDGQVSRLIHHSHTSITLDLTRPNFTVNILNSNQIEIIYTGPVVEADDSNNYEILPSLDSLTVNNQGDNRYYLITSQQQNPRIIYQLIISNVTDSAGNVLAQDQFSFGGYGGISKPLELKLIKASQSHFGQDWNNAIDGDIYGWDGTVRAGGRSCFAIFTFSDRNLHTIHKIRLLTDSGIGASEQWVRKFKIEVSDSDLKQQGFIQVLIAEKTGGNWEDFPINPINALYLKFNVLQPASDWRQLAELEVWGQDSCGILAVEKSKPNHDSSTTEDLTIFDESDNGTEDQSELIDHPIFSNFPNPFNERTCVVYKLFSPSHVRLTIYNIMGEEIKTLVNEWKPVGSYQMSWDGRDSDGLTVPSGIYIIQMRSDVSNQSRKIILMK
ncbi:MAG: CotH kinase family protein, partial [bacterium]